MISTFLKLEWKSFKRSSSFKANLAIKIIIGIAAFFYSLLILFLGVAAFFGLKEEGLEPFVTINHYLIYWWVADLLVRYMLQKTPAMRVRPFLALPLSKNKITHYLLGKSAFSFFNFYPFLFFLPFSITLLFNGYSIIGVLAWHFTLMALTFFNNYLNLAVNNKNAIFATLAIAIVAAGFLHYFQLLDITLYTAPIFLSFFHFPWLFFIVLGFTILVYRYNFHYFRKSLYLDTVVQSKSKAVQIKDYTWLDRFGVMGNFLKNDLRLILRNKRSRNTLWLSIFFLFYGLLIFTSPTYEDSNFWLIFAGIFIPGGFLFTFGGFVPSWDSAYYPLMMSQNIKYKEYLASKWWLMVIATTISIILCSFYLFMGSKYFIAIVVGGIYNIGINAHITLLSGAFVKTPIDLSTGKKPFGDKQSFNAKTLLLTIPKIFLPLGIFYLFSWLYNDIIGFVSIAIAGLIGLIFRNAVFKSIENIYKKQKYDTLYAYKQKN